MSHVMRHDHFIGSQMVDGSHICFRVCIRVHIASHDMIEHCMMWKSIRLCSPGIHIHMGLMVTCDSLNHGFT